MKTRYLTGLILTLLLLTPSVLGAGEFFETFEDESLGQTPTDDGYTFLGGGATVVSGGNPGQAASVLGTGGSERDRWQVTSGWDLCQTDAMLQWDFYWGSDQPDGRWSMGISGVDAGTGSNIASATNEFIVFRTISSLEFFSQSPSSSFFQAITQPPATNEWYRFKIYDVNCASAANCYSYERLSTESIVYSNCANLPGSWSSLTFFHTGQYESGGGSIPLSELDNVCFCDEALTGVAPEAPAGVSATVTRTGSVSTSGIVELSWPVSVSDDNQDQGSLTYTIYQDGSPVAVDSVDADDGGGVRTHTLLFTGMASFGSTDYTVTATGIFESQESCAATVDRDVVGDSDTCGTVPAQSLEPSEFDQGLVDSIESFGFQTVESKMFFALILVGAVQLSAGVASKFVAAGRFKNYLILGGGAIVAVFAVFIDFLDLWQWIVAFMLGLFAVRGAGAARNTYFEIKDAMARRQAGFTETGPAIDLKVQSESPETAPEADADQSTPTDAPEAPDEPETAPNGSRGPEE